MNRKKLHQIKLEKLIQEVNVLGPWIHGYFNLGNGTIIEDKDILQKKRLFALRDYIFNIISNFYGRKKLNDKTLCDVGCNTGYFIYELYKKFNFKNVLGLEPRESNLKKAEFVSKFFKLPKNRFRLKEFDILDDNKIIPKYDVVIMMGVLHHLDNHLQALKKLFKMTKELFILETMVLTDELNTSKIAKQLELKDSLYKNKKNKKKFGLIGYKLESNRLDGATIHSGIVGIPTSEVLLMMLKTVGFEEAYVYRNEKQLRKEVYKEKSYRNLHTAIIVAIKNNKKNKKTSIETILDKNEEDEFTNFIPLEYIEPLFKVVSGKFPRSKLKTISNLIFDSEFHYTEPRGEKASKKLSRKIGTKPYYQLITTLKHAPKEKILFEYAKSSYQNGFVPTALKVCLELVKKINLDWRTVYSTYYLLARINFDIRNIPKSKHFNDLALCAYPSYSLARKLQIKLNKIKR